MILMVIEEETGLGRRVEAGRGMIMKRIEAGTGTETGEDVPNNMSLALTPEICNHNYLQIVLYEFGQLAFCHQKGESWYCGTWWKDRNEMSARKLCC